MPDALAISPQALAAQQRAFERLSPEAKTDRLMRLARGGRG